MQPAERTAPAGVTQTTSSHNCQKQLRKVVYSQREGYRVERAEQHTGAAVDHTAACAACHQRQLECSPRVEARGPAGELRKAAAYHLLIALNTAWVSQGAITGARDELRVQGRSHAGKTRSETHPQLAWRAFSSLLPVEPYH